MQQPRFTRDEWELVLKALAIAGSQFVVGSPSERRLLGLFARVCTALGIDGSSFLLAYVDEVKEAARQKKGAD